MTATPEHATDCTLVLFTKRPRPGVGKQRVADATNARFALTLAERLLDCALEDLAAWPGPRALCVADPDDLAWARILAQGDGNLGERLEQATRQLAPAASPLLFIGSDAPTLTVPYLLRVANALRDHDVALGDATDGGVVAMGCRRGWPALATLPWSTERLAAALADACASEGFTLARLPAHTDVDRVDALDAIAGALAEDRRPARRALYGWLRLHAGATAARDIA